MNHVKWLYYPEKRLSEHVDLELLSNDGFHADFLKFCGYIIYN